MRNYNFRLILCLIFFSASGLTVAVNAQDDYLSDEDIFEEDLTNGPKISDPLGFLNRRTFAFNDWIYLNLLQPVSDGYQTVTPDPVEKAAENFFDNLQYPIRLAGNLLQGRLKGAWVETGRFAINSTVGVLGLFTPADEVGGLEEIPKEDIGQALGTWGIGEGPYLVLPFFGPSNLRDLGGLLGDRAANPLAEPYSLIDDWNWEWRAGLTATEMTVNSPDLLLRYKELKASAIDPYSSLMNGYTQYRRAAIEE
jgi:phospholipid-binding lipoprotein MlaA